MNRKVEAIYLLIALAALVLFSVDRYQSIDDGRQGLPAVRGAKPDPLEAIRSPRWQMTPLGRSRAALPLRG